MSLVKKSIFLLKFFLQIKNASMIDAFIYLFIYLFILLTLSLIINSHGKITFLA